MLILLQIQYFRIVICLLLSRSLNLHSDINKIHAGIGDKLAIFIQWITTFIAGFVIGFVRDWRLTLLLLGFTPFMAIAGAVLGKVGDSPGWTLGGGGEGEE